MKSWKPVVQTDNSGRWYGNSLRFATKNEAMLSAESSAMRWTPVRDYDAHESDDPVNYKIVGDMVVPA